MRRDSNEVLAQDFERALGRMRRAMLLAIPRRDDHYRLLIWDRTTVIVAVSLTIAVLAVLVVGAYLWYTDILDWDLVQVWTTMAVEFAHRLWSDIWEIGS